MAPTRSNSSGGIPPAGCGGRRRTGGSAASPAALLAVLALAAACACLCVLPAASATDASELEDLFKANGLTQFTLYLHEDPNSSFFVVPPLQGFSGNFGALVLIDQKLTVGTNLTSTTVGSGKGLAVFSNNAAAPAPELVWSAVFNDTRAGGYGNSTLSLRGFNALTAAQRELSIVSGTGKFRLAQGWATFSTYFRDSATRVGIQKIDFNVWIPFWAQLASSSD